MRVQARPRTAGKDSWGRARQKRAGRDSRAYQLEPQIIEQGIEPATITAGKYRSGRTKTRVETAPGRRAAW